MISYLCRMVKKPGKASINWDAFGAGASFICAIHCALFPLLLSAVPLLGIQFFENPVIEYSLMVASFFIGLIALYRGYTYHLANILPIILFAIGFPVLVFAHIRLQGVMSYTVITLAAIMIISAHFINWKAHHKPVLTKPINI